MKKLITLLICLTMLIFNCMTIFAAPNPAGASVPVELVIEDVYSVAVPAKITMYPDTNRLYGKNDRYYGDFYCDVYGAGPSTEGIHVVANLPTLSNGSRTNDLKCLLAGDAKQTYSGETSEGFVATSLAEDFENASERAEFSYFIKGTPTGNNKINVEEALTREGEGGTELPPITSKKFHQYFPFSGMSTGASYQPSNNCRVLLIWDIPGTAGLNSISGTYTGNITVSFSKYTVADINIY